MYQIQKPSILSRYLHIEWDCKTIWSAVETFEPETNMNV